MEHAMKLGIGLFLVLSSLVYFVWKLAYYLSEDEYQHQDFELMQWAPTLACYVIGIYMIFRAISDITEDDGDEEEDENLDDSALMKQAINNDSGDSDDEYEDYDDTPPMQPHNYGSQNNIRRRY